MWRLTSEVHGHALVNRKAGTREDLMTTNIDALKGEFMIEAKTDDKKTNREEERVRRLVGSRLARALTSKHAKEGGDLRGGLLNGGHGGESEGVRVFMRFLHTQLANEQTSRI